MIEYISQEQNERAAHISQTFTEYQQWAGAGYAGELMPLVFGDKLLREEGWSTREWPEDLVEARVAAGANVGLRLSKRVALDVEDTPIGNRLRAIIREKYPSAPMRRRPGSNSVAFLFASDGTAAKRQVKLKGTGGKMFFEALAGHKSQLHIVGHRADKDNVRLEWEEFTPAPFLPEISGEEVMQLCEIARAEALAAGFDAIITGTSNAPEAPSVMNREREPMKEFVQPRVLIDVLSILENGDWADFDKWQALVHAVAKLSGGSTDVEESFREWSKPPENTGDITGPVFRKARRNGINMPASSAAGVLAQALEEHGQPGWEEAARDAIAAIKIAALDEVLGELPPPPSVGAQVTTEDKWRAKMSELKAARFEAGQDLNYLGAGDDDCLVDLTRTTSTPRLRPDISDRHARGEITLTAADGGVGKSTMSILFAFAMALNRPELVGLKHFDWMGAVVLVSNEDGAKAIHRTLVAFEQFYKVKKSDYIYALYVWKEDQLSLTSNTGQVVEPAPDAFRLADRLIRMRAEKSIALVVIDTLASATEGSDENAVKDMGVAMRVSRELSRAAFCSVELIHHKKKSAAVGRALATDSRGSGAISASVRSQIDLSKVHPDDADAQDYGWTKATCANRIRLVGTKANGRPLARSQYFEFREVPLPVEDPREPGRLVVQNIGVLAHVPIPQRGSAIARAYDVLAAVHKAGRAIYKGAKTGPGSPETAKTIIANDMEIEPKTAHGLVEEMIAKGWLAEKTVTVDKNKRVELTPVRGGDATIPDEA